MTTDLPRVWRLNDNVLNNYPYNPNSDVTGINPDLFDVLKDGTPFDFFKLIVDDMIVEKIVKETNNYAQQKISSTPLSKCSRLSKWTPSSIEEIHNWLGLVMTMDLVQMREIEMYWSNTTLFSTAFGSIISRNRFQILTTMIHYSNNETADKNNRLYKLGTIVDDIMINSNNCMTPSEVMCIDESVIPFTGRLFFKQYNKNKRHKYGIKLFKLCIPPNNTICIKVYAGKEASPDGSVGTNIVMELAEPFLNFGRTIIIVDNWYTSIELAEKLGEQNTYLIGTLRSNRKSNPKEIIKKKLKKGEVCTLRSNTNVMILKWRDKKELLMCSTKTTNSMVDVRSCKVIQKPLTVIEYNKGKGSIDLADQKSSYGNPLRRSLKWYRKVLVDTLLNISVVNASHIFNSVTESKMSITNFRFCLVESLIKNNNIVHSP